MELRRLKEDNPDLASAVDLQIELLQLQRRVQSRVPLPSIRPRFRVPQRAARRRTDPAVRAPADRLERPAVPAARHGDGDAHARGARGRGLQRAEALCRDAERLPDIVRGWYEAVRTRRRCRDDAAGLEPVLLQAMRPFLTRAADAIMARMRSRRPGTTASARSAAANRTSR